MRRFFLPLLCLQPLTCFALGAEDTEYYGTHASGQVLRLRLVEEPKVWSKQNFVYGAPGANRLSLCWGERVKEIRKSFVCTTAKGAAPTLIYEIQGSPDRQPTFEDKTPEVAAYRVMASKAKLGTGAKRGDGILEAVYTCRQGCTSEVPQYIFEVSKYD